MIFKVEHVNYQSRLRVAFLLRFILLTVIVISIHFQSSSTVELTVSIIVFSGVGLALAAHLKARKYFYQVELIGKTLILKGDLNNTPLTIELPIDSTEIRIISKGNGHGNVDYFIRFKHGKKTYDVNRLFNWNYSTLLDLFHRFKEDKGEKIIWDEKYLLDFMEMKSKGMTTRQIVFGKSKKPTRY